MKPQPIIAPMVQQEYGRVYMRFHVPGDLKETPSGMWLMSGNPKWPKLSAWIFEKLKRFGFIQDPWMRQEIQFREVVIDDADVCEALESAMKHFELIRRGHAKEVLMGPRQFTELQMSAQMVGYNGEIHLRGRYFYFPEYGGPVGMLGQQRPIEGSVPIRVIPWMDGILVA